MTLVSDLEAGVTECTDCNDDYACQGTIDQFVVRLDVFRRVHNGGMCKSVRYEPLADRITCLACGVKIKVACADPNATRRMVGFAEYHHMHCGGAS